ncbi:MAG: hypothetical protein ACYDCL_22535 [Myxococcales bacterium]
MESIQSEVEEIGTARSRLVQLMAEFFRSLGYLDVRARLPGFSQPATINGSLRNHQPDVTCLQNDAQATAIVLDAVPIEQVTDPMTESRWTLFFSAAELYGGEFHIAVPRVKGKLLGPELVRAKLRDLGIRAQYVWAV